MLMSACHIILAPSYVNIVDKFRRCLANFRGSSHELMIEQGRHFGLPEIIVLVHIVKDV